MAGAPKDALSALIPLIKASMFDRDQTADLLGELLGHLIENNIPLGEHWPVSMTIGAYIQKVRAGVPKKEQYKGLQGPSLSFNADFRLEQRVMA